MQQTGVKMVHAPYRGGPLALNDLIAGHIQLIIEVSPVVNEQVRAGTIKGFAVTQPVPPADRCRTCRPSRRPACPASCVTGWLGIYGPPGMPEDVRDKLGAAIVEVVKQPDIAEEAPRHRLRADRAGRQGVHRPPRRRGQALGGVSTPRSACGNSRDGAVPCRADRFAARRRQGVRHRHSWRSTGSISTCATANSCRCSGRPAAASRRRCASSRA